MFPLMPSLIAGGASLLGGFLNSTTSAANTQAQIGAQEQMQQQTESFNANQAQVQRDYETQMSNTAYQRASQDMQKAGLNPMMMFGSGGPSSTPSGATASVGTPSVPLSQRQNPFGQIGQAVSSGIDAMVQGKLVDKMTQEIANYQAEQGKTEATTSLIKGQQKIQDPEVRAALIRMGYPDLLAKSLTYGKDISQGVQGVGDAVWSLVPGGKFIRSLVGGGTAKGSAPSPGDGPVFSPRQNQSIDRKIAESRGTSAGSMTRTNVQEMKDMKAGLDQFMQKNYGGYLGGRNPGQGGSYD